MKTIIILSILLASSIKSYSFTIHAPPLADTVTIQFETGAGVDCRGSSRACLQAQAMVAGETPNTSSEAVARIWFDEGGHFVMEITQALKPELTGELQSGSFRLDGGIPLPGELLDSLDKQGQSFTLKAGTYPVTRLPNGSYRIVFQ